MSKFEQVMFLIMFFLFLISGVASIVFIFMLESDIPHIDDMVFLSTIFSLIGFLGVDLYVKRDENRYKCWRIRNGYCKRG